MCIAERDANQKVKALMKKKTTDIIFNRKFGFTVNIRAILLWYLSHA